MAEQGARWLISGEVQGVGFRWFAARHAEALGLRGWVRNLPDGRVEVVAAGLETQLTELGRQIQDGPRLSRVDGVEKTDIPHEGVECKSFEIR